MAILSNKANNSVLIHLAANATLVVAGNNSVSNLTATATEVIVAASVRRVWWGTSNGAYWTVARGANTLLVLDSTNHLDFHTGAALTKDNTANLVFTLTGTGAVGFITLEASKLSTSV